MSKYFAGTILALLGALLIGTIWAVGIGYDARMQATSVQTEFREHNAAQMVESKHLTESLGDIKSQMRDMRCDLKELQAEIRSLREAIARGAIRPIPDAALPRT